ncbi:unnamed protein product, partial [Ectocarpus sp. 12 AP-2014]
TIIIETAFLALQPTKRTSPFLVSQRQTRHPLTASKRTKLRARGVHSLSRSSGVHQTGNCTTTHSSQLMLQLLGHDQIATTPQSIPSVLNRSRSSTLGVGIIVVSFPS